MLPRTVVGAPHKQKATSIAALSSLLPRSPVEWNTGQCIDGDSRGGERWLKEKRAGITPPSPERAFKKIEKIRLKALDPRGMIHSPHESSA
jgi:hypothetical protein